MSEPIQYKLDHGMTVILAPSHAAPVVSLQAWVAVGSADEQDHEAGLAHFHEHMLFKGTKKRGVGDIAREVERHGGQINAWTSFDETVYHVTLPSTRYEEGLELLADMLQHSTFLQNEIDKEAKVILEEIKQDEDIPFQKVSQALFSLAFSKHTYSRPIIGFPKTVQSFARNDLIAFYQKWYSPHHITLVLSGDFYTENAKKSILQHFSQWQGPSTLRRRVHEPPQEKMRCQLLQDDIQDSYVCAGFPIPGLLHNDLFALEMLAVLLGQGESSRLELELKRNEQSVSEASSHAYSLIDHGLFFISLVLQPGLERKAIQSMIQQIVQIQCTPPSRKELEKARVIIESDAIYNRETMQGLGRTLGYYQTMTGDLQQEAAFYEGIAKVSPNDIKRVANQYLCANKMNLVLLAPSQQKTQSILLEQDILQSYFEKKEKKKKNQVKQRELQQYTLSNGVRVLIKHLSHAPLLAVRAGFFGGLLYECPENNGISHLCACLLTKGTSRRTAEMISERIEEIGASLHGFSGRNSMGLQGDFLHQDFEEGLDLFLDCLLSPQFEQHEIEREKYFILENIRGKEDQPSVKAFELFSKTLFQKHPYHMPLEGTEDSIHHICREAITTFYQQRLNPRELVVSIIGDLTDIDLLQTLEERLGKLQKTPLKNVHTPDNALPMIGIRKVIEYKEKMQAHIVLGFLGTKITDPDRYVFEVLNGILSGQGGRLFLTLRDEEALAYSVSSLSLELVEPGYFAVYIATDPEKINKAVQSILEQLQRVCKEAVPEQELESVKQYLIGTHAIELQRYGSQAISYGLSELYGLGAKQVEQYPACIKAVKSEDLQRIAKKYFQLEAYTLAIVQPSSKDQT